MLSIDINKPQSEVLNLFSNPNNRPIWLEGFASSSLISGTEGEVGAKSEIEFLIGNRKVKLIETIKVNSLPDEFTCTYESPGLINTVKCMFSEITNTSTDFCTVQQFQFKGLFKIIGFLRPGTFKRKSVKYITDFKRFCECS